MYLSMHEQVCSYVCACMVCPYIFACIRRSANMYVYAICPYVHIHEYVHMRVSVSVHM